MKRVTEDTAARDKKMRSLVYNCPSTEKLRPANSGTSLTKNTYSKTIARHLRTACATILLQLLLFLLLPAAIQAQDYTYTTNNGTITVTGYTGPGGAVTIPSEINGLPVTSIGHGPFLFSRLTSVMIPQHCLQHRSGGFL
jgi:hypothetical protein